MSIPFMQLYIGDYLRDTRHLSTEQHGAYMLLLMSMWNSDGWIPNEEAKLARLAGLPLDRWRRIGPDVMDLMVVSGGRVTQKRLQEEMEKAREKSQRRGEAGRRGGEAKSLKNKGVPPSNARDLPPILPQHLPEPDSEPEERKKVSPPTKPSQPSLLADASETVVPKKAKEEEFARFYAAFPRHTARGAAETAYWRARKAASPEAILAGALRYAASRKGEEGRFTKHPATWLNGKCWLDEGPGGAQPVSAVDAATWLWRLEAFHHGKPGTDEDRPTQPGHWSAAWGPEPGQPGCLVPAEAIEAYRRRRPPAAAVGGA